MKAIVLTLIAVFGFLFAQSANAGKNGDGPQETGGTASIVSPPSAGADSIVRKEPEQSSQDQAKDALNQVAASEGGANNGAKTNLPEVLEAKAKGETCVGCLMSWQLNPSDSECDPRATFAPSHCRLPPVVEQLGRTHNAAPAEHVQ